ncbi:uncharacterized protein LOC128550838 [Mercenaria mercenaria]|uniref:uncharacterized protein LOC128550838 n=1 Tax=Mercenaria mercenaria TaxID=6596 RepID=UPI00234F6AEC|nr:uncharacterized protein LOC128550838 [Mercenaria mercenaria]
MEHFCGRESFWNSSLTWGDYRSYPGFTECFQNTVLLWVPSGWLWLTIPFYIPYLRSQSNTILPKSWKNLSKMFIALLQLVILVLKLSYRAVDLKQRNETLFQAFFVGPLVEALTLVLVAFYIELDRRKGQITSDVLFTYWVLVNITSIIPFYIKIIEQVYIFKPLDFALFIVYFFLCLVQLVLSCFAETLPAPEGKVSACRHILYVVIFKTTINYKQSDLHNFCQLNLFWNFVRRIRKKYGRRKASPIYKSSEEYFEYSCDPCNTVGDHVEAQGYCTNCEEYLCGTCFRSHSRSKASRHHTLLDKDAMPRITAKNCDPCKTAGDEIEAAGYCKDCDEYLCDSCYKSHSRSKTTRHHALEDKDRMPRKIRPSCNIFLCK